MTEPLPCPFCGHVGVTHSEGSTFRWLVTECNGCGAQCEEERIDTLSTDRGAAIEQAAEAAIKTWNTRAAQRKPLTTGEIDLLAGKNQNNDGTVSYLLFARAIEAAHNIKEEA